MLQLPRVRPESRSLLPLQKARQQVPERKQASHTPGAFGQEGEMQASQRRVEHGMEDSDLTTN